MDHISSGTVSRERILTNSAECIRCGHVLHSVHRHDYRTHSCAPDIWFMVDGGTEYLRRGWKGNTFSQDHYIERSIVAID